MKREILDLTFDELKSELAALGERPFRAGQIFSWLYKKRASSFEEMTSLSKDLRAKLGRRFSLGRLTLADRLASDDGTVKFLFRLADSQAVETVLIPAGRRLTVCLSTQVGCKFGCAFCASGMNGFKRNLAPSEIVGQVLAVGKEADEDVTNFVFMGMGEPLDNFDSVAAAIRIVNAPEGLAIAARRLTISTAGFVPGIARLAALGLQVNLSVSLHAATDTLRSRLMPINRKFPLEKLIEACEAYMNAGGRMITLEYILIHGVNDSLDAAEGLAGIARRLKAKVNLIGYSPVCGLAYKTPTPGAIARFERRLEERGVRATLRESKGADIAAACGQLAGRMLQGPART